MGSWQQLQSGLKLILGIAAAMWLVALANLVTGLRLSDLGVYPRTVDGLIGIPLSPLIHHSLPHVAANTIPFAVLGGLVVLRGPRVFWQVTIGITLIGGTAVWLLARPAYHAGASGLIFGYFGYLVACAWDERSFSSLMVAILVVFLYGGMLWGVLPSLPGISWEGHLFGLAAGVACSRLMSQSGSA